MGGQMIGQVVDSLTPSGQLQHPNAMTAAGTNRNSSTAILGAAVRGQRTAGRWRTLWKSDGGIFTDCSTVRGEKKWSSS